eukprot:4695480-Pleurochrysis_carterae.AAC.4
MCFSTRRLRRGPRTRAHFTRVLRRLHLHASPHTSQAGCIPTNTYAPLRRRVGPTAVRCPGAGRGFLSRRLLNAPSLDAAVRVVTDATQSAGHNYQLVDTRAAVAINLEAAPDGVCVAARRASLLRAKARIRTHGLRSMLVNLSASLRRFDERICENEPSIRLSLSVRHSYQLHVRAGHAVCVGCVATRSYAVRPASAAAFFHANEYETLSVPQTIGNSSTHRRVREGARASAARAAVGACVRARVSLGSYNVNS